ncbi:MAG TPA: hypothetical protein VF116_21420 [Ktedonobacterales bacterium]
MSQSQLVAPVSGILDHLIALRINAPLQDETAWMQRWLELTVYGCTAGDKSQADATTLVVRPSKYTGAFTVREEYPAGQATARSQTYARDEDELLRKVEWLAYDAAVGRAAFPFIIHAGAVSRDGVAMVFPAASGAGKTTLTFGLAARGWLPLCDDICPLDERADGTFVAVGCPRCGHLNLHSEGILRRAGVELDGPVAGLSGYYRPMHWGQPAPVRAIVVPHHQEGAALCVEALTQAEGAAALYGATFRRERISRRDEWAAARRLAVQVPAFRLTYGSLDSALAGVDTITTTVGDLRAPTQCVGTVGGGG